jgi:O-antigen/teichoic acid export membrane protein
MANGLGLAISAQGDRMLVGALLGVDALGLYAVVMLAVLVPVSLVQRLMGALAAAALFNAGTERPETLRLIARLAPALGAVYAGAALCFANLLTPALFGARFVLSKQGLALVAVAALLRIARAEPFTALLLLDQRTRRVAAGNLASLAALAFAAGLMAARPSVESALAGRCLGEALALGLTFLLSRRLLGAAAEDYLWSLALAGGFIASLLALR